MIELDDSAVRSVGLDVVNDEQRVVADVYDVVHDEEGVAAGVCCSVGYKTPRG